MTKLQMIGGGKMGEALLGGLIASGWAAPDELLVIEPSAERRKVLASALPGVVVGTEMAQATDALIAVKPDVVDAVVEALAEHKVTRVLSIAAGVTSAAIEARLGAGVPVVRCMPNTPALVGFGAAAIAAGGAASADDLVWARSILEAVGTVQIVDEADLDAVTGLSGSGPAYVFALAEALIAAGIEQGLDPAIADALTRQTLRGAAELLAVTGDDPAQLRRNVTSPGGTTAAGLAVFADSDLNGLVSRVVAAATARSRELGAR